MPASGDDRCARLLRGLEAGGESRAAAVSALRGSVRQMSLHAAACRVVQQAFEVADSRAAGVLAQELQGHVRELVASPHGNYVLQKVVEVVPSAMTGFIPQELCGIGAEVARHRYGCRILCRLVEHAAAEPTTSNLLDELLSEAPALCRHPFARHVLQSLLEHGDDAQQRRVAEALCGDLHQLAANRSASYVIETALTSCAELEQRALAAELLSDPHALLVLADHPFGCFVVRAIAQLSEDSREVVLRSLRTASVQLKPRGQAQRLLETLEADSR